MKNIRLGTVVSIILFLLVASLSFGITGGSKGDVILDPWPKPSSYVNGIPVYKTFEELESLFHFDNDSTYVINFWATWCKPCVEELPYLEELHAKTKGTKTKVILISLDFPRQIESKLVPFVRERKLEPDVIALLDGKFNKWIDKVSPEWDGTIPATYIYKDSKSVFVGKAFHSLADIENEILKL